MKAEIMNWNTDYVTRTGRRRGQWRILVKFTTFTKRLEVVKYMRNLVGIMITVDDFST